MLCTSLFVIALFVDIKQQTTFVLVLQFYVQDGYLNQMTVCQIQIH